MRGWELADVLPRAVEIVADVRRRGDVALLAWTERLEGERPAALRVASEVIAAARLEADCLEAVRRLAGAVAAFHTPQRPPDTAAAPFPGVEAERRFRPLASVGIYVPGGRAAYPSSLVMAAVPAQLAGVGRIA
ncbi:MAG: histidinol dehydrogenase, partial [Solirubrobacterales bacterium]